MVAHSTTALSHFMNHCTLFYSFLHIQFSFYINELGPEAKRCLSDVTESNSTGKSCHRILLS